MAWQAGTHEHVSVPSDGIRATPIIILALIADNGDFTRTPESPGRTILRISQLMEYHGMPGDYRPQTSRYLAAGAWFFPRRPNDRRHGPCVGCLCRTPSSSSSIISPCRLHGRSSQAWNGEHRATGAQTQPPLPPYHLGGAQGSQPRCDRLSLCCHRR